MYDELGREHEPGQIAAMKRRFDSLGKKRRIR
ncbi:hypothetical protein DFR49_2359 [Hephaestia caeni]|jgi:hypothetical protein|uniref:Uncharacterized protein n=1 Tax=Hephaestia caeni TaxID=645617 RepID=A0A397PEN2_9SPHN|nr:hypothetical protein DFR49_2359 [Hephaestia caeni]